MNVYLFIDTETDGLPRPGFSPHLVTLSWLLCSAEGNCIKQEHTLVKPEGFIIPPEATRVHGISHEQAVRAGIRRRVALTNLVDQVRPAGVSVIVGHNLSFDLQVLAGELQREGISLNFRNFHQICTMAHSTEFCRLPGGPRGAYKWPKLTELHQRLFGSAFLAHTSATDVEATRKCFFKLVELGLITLPGRRIGI